MNDVISNVLAQGFSGLDFVTSAAGLVYDVKLKKKDKVITLPASQKVYKSVEECITDQTYTHLVPTSKDTGIIYFEDLDSDMITKTDLYEHWRGSLKLIGWFNILDACTKENGFTGTEDLKCLIKDLVNGVSFTGFAFKGHIEVDKEYSKLKNPFSRFSYDEARTQYLVHPFDFISLRITYNIFIKCGCSLGERDVAADFMSVYQLYKDKVV